MAPGVLISRTNPRFPGCDSQEQECLDENPRSPVGSVKAQTHKGQSLDLNESSPLLSPIRINGERTSEDHDVPTGLLDWSDGQEEQSKSVFYLFILTLSIGG